MYDLQVYRSVLLTSRKRRGSGSSDSSKNEASGSSSPVNVEEKEKESESWACVTNFENRTGWNFDSLYTSIMVLSGKFSLACFLCCFTGKESLVKMRSSSTLPVPQPTSQPPTPTRLAGTVSSFEFEDRGEDRGDLIKFYNTLFIKKVKTFALKFGANNINQEGVSSNVCSSKLYTKFVYNLSIIHSHWYNTIIFRAFTCK